MAVDGIEHYRNLAEGNVDVLNALEGTRLLGDVLPNIRKQLDVPSERYNNIRLFEENG